MADSPALVAGLFGERYGFPPGWGVTQRCLLGGMSRRGDRSPEGATGPAGGRCQGIRPRSRARATASVRLAAPSLPRTWVMCWLLQPLRMQVGERVGDRGRAA
jgi:hypothetical protein